MTARPWSRRAALALLAMSASGCARYYYGEQVARAPVDLVVLNQAAADALLEQASLDPAQAVIVGTVVQVDRLDASSRLGRLISEQVAGRLTQHGLRVAELRLRETLALRQGQGTLVLSRNAYEVSRAHAAQAVVAGTYAVAAGAVFVSMKLIAPQGNTVLAAYDYTLPLDGTVRSLLVSQ